MVLFRKYFPLVSGLLILSVITVSALILSINATHGKFIYILDDAYIHMAFAKNAALNEMPGITPYETSSSSSSPLWSFILFLTYSAFGVNDYFPLIINFALSCILLAFIFYLFNKSGFSGFFNLFSLSVLIILTPFAINIFTGMEHILHTLFVIPFIYFSASTLVNERHGITSDYKTYLIIFLTAAFLSSVRYESLVLILIVSVLFLMQRKFLTSALILFSGLMPVLIYGLFSVSLGGMFLPNSVLIKLSGPDSLNLFNFTDLLLYTDMNKKIIFIFLLTVFLFIKQYKLKRDFWSQIPLSLFITALMIIIQKISFSLSFFRYDTYLIVTGLAFDLTAACDLIRIKYKIELNGKYFLSNKTVLTLFIFINAVLIYKINDSSKIITASVNIYEQQYQMSRFINRFYKNESVALNDIGVVNYYNEISCLDLIGIGSNVIAKEKADNNFSRDRIKEISELRKVKIAILYDSWFGDYGGLPGNWIKAGEWKIINNFICGDETVSIYAVDKNESDRLCSNLKKFSAELPETVIQNYFCNHQK